jgi:hypothetical protein
VDSFANWIVPVDLGVSSVSHLKVKKNCQRTYGDDFLQGWAGDVPTREELVNAAHSRWGFAANKGNAREGSLWCTGTNCFLPLLSYRFPSGLPARPIQHALKIGFRPNKAANFLARHFRRLVYLGHFPIRLRGLNYFLGNTSHGYRSKCQVYTVP